MPRVLCMELGCNETVEIPGDTPVAVSEEYLPPDREIEVVCANGHINCYVVGA